MQTSYIDRHFNKGELDYHDWMKADLYWLAKADIIVFLPGWQDSHGACIEHMVAKALGKEIIYFEAYGKL